MKKRVLLVSMMAYPLFNKNAGLAYGGAELDLYNIATSLNPLRFDVHFLTGDFGQPENEQYKNVIVHRGQKVRNSGFLEGLRNFYRFLKVIKIINPDIIFTEATGWLTIECIFAKILFQKKLVFRSAHIKNINGFTDSRSYGRLYRALINHIDCFILQNDQDLSIFQSNFNFRNKIIVIRNLQNIPHEKPKSRQERTHLLWVGRSEKVKDPWLFIKVAHVLPEYSFIMITPETNHAIFQDLLKTVHETPNIQLIPGLNRDDLMPYFSNAMFLINTSIEEGFPNVILEALKHGTPIISARLDFDSILKKHQCGTVSGDSPESIAETIKNTSASTWSTYSNNSYRFSRDNFNIVKGIKDYEKLFLQI